MTTTTNDPKRRVVFALLGVSILGAILAFVLWMEHKYGGQLIGCTTGGTFDCQAVNHSGFSELRGISIAFFGFVNYVLIAGLSITRLRRTPEESAGSMAYAFILSTVALLFAAFLFYVSAFILHHFCLYCVSLYVTNIALFVLSWIAIGGPAHVGAAIRQDWDGLGQQRWLAYGLVAVMFVSAVWMGTHCPVTSVMCPVGFNAPGVGEIPAENKDQYVEEINHAPFLDPGPGGAYCEGASNPKLTIIEFGDLECPACRGASWTLFPWVQDHPNEVRICFRHYPLDMGCNPVIKHPKHLYACETARAAEAAGVQGGPAGFWNYVESVYAQSQPDTTKADGEPDLSHAALLKRATAQKLDPKKFEESMGDINISDKVLDDVTVGNQVGIQSTPTFFVNGRMIAGGHPTKAWDTWLEMAQKGELASPNATPTAATSATTSASK